MNPKEKDSASATLENAFLALDVEKILRERKWFAGEISPAQFVWCERAGSFLGPHSADATALGEFLELIFHYDAQESLQRVESHITLSRVGAREVLRSLALFLLDCEPLNSGRFSEIISRMKETIEIRGRDLFHTVRLALAGREGTGELDRVILLIDEAAAAFEGSVKTAKTRIIEFCGLLD